MAGTAQRPRSSHGRFRLYAFHTSPLYSLPAPLILNLEIAAMRTIALLVLGVIVGWAANGVDWSREAFAQEAPRRGAERSIRRERDGALRRRVLPPREAEAPTPATEAPPFDPNTNVEPGASLSPGPSPGMEKLAEPVLEPTHAVVSSPPL